MRPYSAACLPYRWMLVEESAELVELYDLGYQPDREPDLTALLPATPQWPRDPV